MFYRDYLKPLFDLLVALGGLIFLSPIFIVVTIILGITNNGKPFFFQSRPGKNEKLFKVIKFKTMTDKRDKDGNLLPDAKRLTAAGKFIRKTSLDEIPQLLNVIKGDMSLIGPRPLLVKYLPFYTEAEKIRFTVRPGITGWAQVNGRNTVKWDQRLSYDMYYVNHLSLSLDLRILFLTAKNIVTSKDVIVDTSSVMLDFDQERLLNKNAAPKS